MTSDPNAPRLRHYSKLRAFLDWPEDASLSSPARAQGADAREPKNRAMVRKSAPSRAPAIDNESPVKLGDAARAALLFKPDAETTTFDIALDEQLLGNVRCRISFGKEGIEAIFVVSHSTERWLLEGEVPRLRRLLEERGLTVRRVTVVDEKDADAPDLLT